MRQGKERLPTVLSYSEGGGMGSGTWVAGYRLTHRGKQLIRLYMEEGTH